MPVFGRQTVVRFLGGELVFRLVGRTGPDDWILSVRRMERRMADFTPAWDRLKPHWIGLTRRVFDAQGLPHRWRQLSERYRAWKARHFPGKTILRRTDRLYRSLTGGPGMVWRSRKHSLQYGSKYFTFVFHQRGTSRLPRRQMIVLTQQLKHTISRLVLRYVATGRAS